MKERCENFGSKAKDVFACVQKVLKKVLARSKRWLCSNAIKIALGLVGIGLFVVAGIVAYNNGGQNYFWGIVVGIVGVVGVWTITMIAYFLARKKWAHSKYGVEAIFISIVLIVGVAIGTIWFAVSNMEAKGLNDGVTAAFASFYSAIGKFLFEGMDDIAHPIITPVFYGWAIYAGLTFVSIVTAKANYEFFSRARLLLPEKRRDIYIFTALTEETLEIAQSIERAYLSGGENKRAKGKPKIIFAGPSLDPFDRKDELCRKVMASNFIYWSFITDNDEKKNAKKNSIATLLHLNNNNYQNYKRRFVIFAFESENKIPCEESNMELVFSDVETRINNGDDGLRIEYYILTKRNISYEAYDYKNRELMWKYYEKNKDIIEQAKGEIAFDEDELKKDVFSSKIDKTGVYSGCEKAIKNAYFDHVVINVWSEATAIAKDVTRKITQFLVDKMEGWETQLPSSKDNNTYADLNVWCLGFGPTAQGIAQAIYCQSSYIDKEGNVSIIKIDAFDKKMDSIAGLYKKEHPMGIYVETKKADDKEKEEELSLNEIIKEKRTKLNKCRYGKNDDSKMDAVAEKEMSYPIYRFYKQDCRSEDFINKLDIAIGKEQESENKKDVEQQPDVFIVATGSDYNNIRVANALMQDTINESDVGSNKKQIMLVNVWDEKNNDLLLTCGGTWDAEPHRKLTIQYGEGETPNQLIVYIIGNNTEIYTTKIIDVEEPSEYNQNYSAIYDDIYNKNQSNDEEFLSERKKIFQYGEPLRKENQIMACKIDQWLSSLTAGLINNKEIKETTPTVDQGVVAKCNEEAANGGRKEAKKPVANKKEGKDKICQYNRLEIWLKESNVQAALYQGILRPLVEKLENETQDRGSNLDKCGEYFSGYRRLAMMEHQRWSRAHIMAGWEYKPLPEKRELAKQHPSIVPYEFVKGQDYFYDIINVLMAKKEK